MAPSYGAKGHDTDGFLFYFMFMAGFAAAYFGAASIWREDFLLRSLRPLPGVTFPTVLAAIVKGLPVWGFRPVRAALLRALNVPKPISDTLSFSWSAHETAQVKVAGAFSVSPFEIPAPSDMYAASSALVLLTSFWH